MARVLVTGSAGAIGRPACAELRAAGHVVRAFDRRATPDVDESMQGDMADRDAVSKAMSGADAVVHLAAIPNDAPIEALIGPNVLGVHHLLESARASGVRRVVLASTVQTIGQLSRERRVTVDDRAPGNRYALTKIWNEEMGALAARVHGLEVVAARISWMVRTPDEAKRMNELRAFDLYLSPRDAARFLRIAVEAKVSGFSVVFVAGPECENRYDLEPARRLGFVPRDPFPQGLDFPVERVSSAP
ncbi:MAG TPA: NAD(P)-dependent oxidoreductase [Polyangiaceae bacterium]|nr:NAD(P)-dependent oxidoreductase [Polyangiaceae bacterium]